MCKIWSAGIGRSITKIEQIDALQRPITMEDGGMVLMDLLWSDPTTNDGVEGVQPSPRGPGLVTFGPDRVKEFCKVHWLMLLMTCWTVKCQEMRINAGHSDSWGMGFRGKHEGGLASSIMVSIK